MRNLRRFQPKRAVVGCELQSPRYIYIAKPFLSLFAAAPVAVMVMGIHTYVLAYLVITRVLSDVVTT